MTDTDSLFAAFYKPPNEIVLDELEESVGDLVRVLRGRVDQGRRTLLPARVNRNTRWYGFTPTGREARLLLEEMQSWLGPPISDSASVVGPAPDEIDKAALDLATGEIVLRTDVIPGWQRVARENVRSLVDLWSITPERSADMRRPVGRVLREFYESVSARDRASAEGALEEIRAGALLSATNVRFLRVELIGSLGSAAEMKDDSALRDISSFHRPPAVTEHLVKAADELFIEPHVGEIVEVMWRDVAEQIEDTWPGLISHVSQVLSVSGARCLALRESLTEHPRRTVCDALTVHWGDDLIVQTVIEGVRPGPLHIGPANLFDLYHRGEYELVLELAEDTTPDPDAACAALHAALNLGDATSATRAVALVERLTEESREALLAQAVERSFYEQLQEHNDGNRIPQSWRDWLVGDWPDRPDLLREWSANWDRQDLSNSAWGDTLALELLEALNDDRRGRTRNGLPVLVGWIVTRDGLQPGAISLATTILDIMLESDPGRIERQASLELLDEILSTGCSAGEYETTISALSGQVARIGPREAEWITGALDLLLYSTTPDSSQRAGFIADALKVAKSWYGRLEPTEAVLLSRLFADAGHEYELPPTAEEDEEPRRTRRSFARVGIYSLAESAAQNAARWIEDEWPDVEVRLSHAHSNSSALEAFVRSSDVVLVQTSHAKHAATDAINAASTDHSRIVLVNGRGATSLLRGLLDWETGEA